MYIKDYYDYKLKKYYLNAFFLFSKIVDKV